MTDGSRQGYVSTSEINDIFKQNNYNWDRADREIRQALVRDALNNGSVYGGFATGAAFFAFSGYNMSRMNVLTNSGKVAAVVGLSYGAYSMGNAVHNYMKMNHRRPNFAPAKQEE